jgi:hypothetical protein
MGCPGAKGEVPTTTLRVKADSDGQGFQQSGLPRSLSPTNTVTGEQNSSRPNCRTAARLNG